MSNIQVPALTRNGSEAIYRLVFCFLLLALFDCGCGYRVASKNRLDPAHLTLAVLPLENQTSTYEVEQILTRSLIQEFVSRSSYKVVNDPRQADLVLAGNIRRLRVSPVTFGRAAFGSTFLITMQLQIQLTERESRKVLYKDDGYIFRDQYVIAVEVENFFSELNPALQRISEDFASSVVTSILEGF